tara:strand:- start:417 stop:917 length:501 start_codon:yes stop_codon:yes gene_type:complete
MPNLITGLRYQPNIQKAETEQQLLEVFADLGVQYLKFNQSFKISTLEGEPIEDFEHFLQHSTQEGSSVVLNGSGDVGGLVVRDASLVYDLSPVGNLTMYWDSSRDGSCHSCRNHRYEEIGMEMENSCNLLGRENMVWQDCSKYDPRRRNSEGKAARKLKEIISEAI